MNRSSTKVASNTFFVSALTFGAAACASSSADIKAAYVSPLAYQPYDCAQLSAEAERISARAAEAAGVQDAARTSDTVATTVGVVIFWPALFAVKGDSNNAAEMARLKGDMDAIEEESIRKKCGITFRKSEQPPPS
jgi:hypothetical protein